MAEKMEDLNLPQSVVIKIIKEAIPNNAIIGKDVKAALAKAASIFILYLTSQSTQTMQAAKRKTITSQDIFEALEELEFRQFIEPLKQCLKEKSENEARAKAEKSKAKTAENTENGEEEAEEDEEAEDGE